MGSTRTTNALAGIAALTASRHTPVGSLYIPTRGSRGGRRCRGVAVAEGVQRTEHECWLSCSSRSSSSSSLRLPPLHVRRWLVAVAAHQQPVQQATDRARLHYLRPPACGLGGCARPLAGCQLGLAVAAAGTAPKRRQGGHSRGGRPPWLLVRLGLTKPSSEPCPQAASPPAGAFWWGAGGPARAAARAWTKLKKTRRKSH